jgi:hypothetical protein
VEYYLEDQVKNNEMGRECRSYWVEERSVKGSFRKSEGKRPLGRPCHRWKDTIKMYRQGTEWVRGLV